MLDQPADVPPRRIGNQRVPVLVEEQVVRAVPQAHVHVHPGAVVAEHRLRHERRRVAVRRAHVLDDVLVHHDLVRHARQRVVPHVDLGLARRTDLMVVDFHLDARRDHRQHDLGAQILQPVGRWHREVALLVARPVAQVGRSVRAGVPDAFFRIDVVIALVRVLVEAHGVEDVELRLGSEIRRRGDATLLQKRFRFAGYIPRIAGVGLAGDGIDDVAGERERRDLQARIDESARRIRQQQHVALVDCLKAADRRAVKSQAVGERIFLELLQRNREMLPGAGQIREPHVHDLYSCFLGAADHIRRRGTGDCFRTGADAGFQRCCH